MFAISSSLELSKILATFANYTKSSWVRNNENFSHGIIHSFISWPQWDAFSLFLNPWPTTFTLHDLNHQNNIGGRGCYFKRAFLTPRNGLDYLQSRLFVGPENSSELKLLDIITENKSKKIRNQTIQRPQLSDFSFQETWPFWHVINARDLQNRHTNFVM